MKGPLWKGFAARRARPCKNLTDLAIRENVRFLLICGDLYDRECKDYNTGFFLVKEMARLREAGIEVFNIGMLHTSVNGRGGHEPYALSQCGKTASYIPAPFKR